MVNDMRIVFFGTPELAVPSLEAVAMRHDLLAVVCQPDRPRGRGRKPEPPPVKQWAVEAGIPVVQPEKLNDGAFEAWLRDQKPDLCAVAAYGRMLRQPILDVPPRRFLNLHPSLLPRYRGPSPVQSAILNGDTVTGVTIMDVILAMDAGDILLQEETEIAPDDTTESLMARLAQLGAHLLVEAIDQVAAGTATFTPQDPSLVVECRKLDKEDGRIDWTKPAHDIHNLVRAAVPWPIAYTSLNGEPVRLHKTQPLSDLTGTPGLVLQADKETLIVGTGAGALSILVLQAPGKRAIPVADFLRGRPIETGQQFGDA